jgi:hypothetical protein
MVPFRHVTRRTDSCSETEVSNDTWSSGIGEWLLRLLPFLEETACKEHSSISPITRDVEAAIPVPHTVSVELKKLSLLEGECKWTSNPFQPQLLAEGHHLLG